MEHPINKLQRIGLKLFLKPNHNLNPTSLITVFHHWIQIKAVPELLIDVADYTHLSNGPKVLLIGHEGNYALDDRNGKLGLSYYKKQPSDETLANRILSIGQTLFKASYLIETDETLGGNFKFNWDELEFFSNDRLLAPSNQSTIDTLRPVLKQFLADLHEGQSYEIKCHPNLKDRLTIQILAANNFFKFLAKNNL